MMSQRGGSSDVILVNPEREGKREKKEAVRISFSLCFYKVARKCRIEKPGRKQHAGSTQLKRSSVVVQG